MTWLDYKVLSLEDIHLGYPGQFGPDHCIHQALAALNPGDKLTMRLLQGAGVGLFDQSDTCVARLSRSAQADWAQKLASIKAVRVLAIIRRSAEQDTEETRRERYAVRQWEVPLVEIVIAL